MKKKINNLERYSQQIQSLSRVSLGHESMMDFNFGFIKCLLKNKLIDRKEYNKLKKVYTYENEYCHFYIEDGELKIYED